jgi:hypothetical protein
MMSAVSGGAILAGLFWVVRGKSASFAVPLPNSIRVVRKILDLYVLVRIQVGQQETPRFARGFVLSGNGHDSLIYLATTSMDILLFIFLPDGVPLSPTGYLDP